MLQYEPDRLHTAIDENFSGWHFTVRSERSPGGMPDSRAGTPAGQSGPIRYAPYEGPTRSLAARGATEAKYVRSEIRGDRLVLMFRTDEASEFRIEVAKEELRPIDFPGRTAIDLEQEIAEALVVRIDETIFRFSARQLDGKSISEL